MSISSVKKEAVIQALKDAILTAKSANILICWSFPNDTGDTGIPEVLKEIKDLTTNIIIVNDAKTTNKIDKKDKFDLYVEMPPQFRTTSIDDSLSKEWHGSTSAATAFASGTAALLYGMKNGVTPQEVKKTLLESRRVEEDAYLDAVRAVSMFVQNQVIAP